MSVSIGSMHNSGREKTVATAVNGLPAWSYIPTAGKQTKSKIQFTTEIKELAQKAALASNEREREAVSKQVLKLRAEYLSDVAPDRKKLYNQAENVVKKKNTKGSYKGIGELSLLDFLKEQDGLKSNQMSLAGGVLLQCPALSTGGCGVEIQYQGTTVLRNTGGGWAYEMTPAEQTKKNEFYSIYWNAYDAVKAKNKPQLADLPDYLEKKPRFDQKA